MKVFVVSLSIILASGFVTQAHAKPKLSFARAAASAEVGATGLAALSSANSTPEQLAALEDMTRFFADIIDQSEGLIPLQMEIGSIVTTAIGVMSEAGTTSSISESQERDALRAVAEWARSYETKSRTFSRRIEAVALPVSLEPLLGPEGRAYDTAARELRLSYATLISLFDRQSVVAADMLRGAISKSQGIFSTQRASYLQLDTAVQRQQLASAELVMRGNGDSMSGDSGLAIRRARIGIELSESLSQQSGGPTVFVVRNQDLVRREAEQMRTSASRLKTASLVSASSALEDLSTPDNVSAKTASVLKYRVQAFYDADQEVYNKEIEYAEIVLSLVGATTSLNQSDQLAKINLMNSNVLSRNQAAERMLRARVAMLDALGNAAREEEAARDRVG